MTPKRQTEQEWHERPLAPFENAKIRAIIRRSERLDWLWSKFKIGVVFGVSGITLALMVKSVLLGGDQ